MTTRWAHTAAAHANEIFARHGVRLTLGGEPTYIPRHPDGAEWNHAALGPTKLSFAWKVAEALRKSHLPGAAAFYCPGKSYPGEANPRWVIRLLANRDGRPLLRLPTRGKVPTAKTLRAFTGALSRRLGVSAHWLALRDPADKMAKIFALPLDHDGQGWRSARWVLPVGRRRLNAAEGPAGLRLPLHELPARIPRRVLTVSLAGHRAAVFFPPLGQEAFLVLLAAVEAAAQSAGLTRIELQGYLPADDARRWVSIGLSADPGVLEVNLPACADWSEFARWLEAVTDACAKAGLRPWRESRGDHPQGTGGGNHLLWGGPSLKENPFFTRPAWLASVLRYWQHHPCLGYLFTGCYVGPSSQAPRADESARDLHDIEMAYTSLQSLPPGDHRELIHETLRHLHTDVTGNPHRSEISFDKFWNPTWPGGALGLIEFRAMESLPRADWMAAVALLWTALAAAQLESPTTGRLRRFGRRLHDEFFLPTCLWHDLGKVFVDLEKRGFSFKRRIYRDIWNWRFPLVLEWKSLAVRRALEGWPLLCETPAVGGSTSRFVDASMHRLEFFADDAFARRFAVHVAGRVLPLRRIAPDTHLAGLRYRRSNLHPALHPGIPVQLPLPLSILERTTGRVAAAFSLAPNSRAFRPAKMAECPRLGGKRCRGGHRGALTFDLRLS